MRILRRLSLLISVAVLMAAVAAPGAPAAKRYQGYVAGVATGPGHSFNVGNGLYIVFRDTQASGTRYTACLRRMSGGTLRCYRRRTGAKGAPRRIFTPAPQGVGRFQAVFFAGGSRVDVWSFYNGVGD